MWHSLSLTLLLVASMARSGGSTGSMATCPENCECTIILNHNDEISNNNNDSSMEVRCDKRPRIESLPQSSRILVVEEAQPYEIKGLSFDLENSENVALLKLAVINCSLTSFNLRLGRVSRDRPITKSLNLSCNKIEDVRRLTIKDGELLAELDLSENLIKRVITESFVDYRKLSKLYLRRNVIETIENNGFSGLDRLENLDLSDNHLASLAEDTFVPLCSLKSLNLSGNRLGILGRQWLDNLGHLRELDVSRNEERLSYHTSVTSSESEELSLVLGNVRRLEIIDASRIGLERVPAALTRSVRSLNLSGNKLSVIRSGDFDSYPLLRVLDLSYNLITIVENDALGRLEVLESLDLSGNRLRELPQSLPADLRRLVARKNLIYKLGRRDLEELGKLESLVLDENHISEIEEGSMSQLQLLNELDVSNNPIKQLPADTFGGPSNLVVLRMSKLSLLQWEREKRADMTFPVPAPERLVFLDLSGSPALAAQLLADEAALSACKSLKRLDISSTNLTDLRSDLPYLIPQLRTLGLSGNLWNCKNEEDRINWLAGWIREHEEIKPRGECSFENGTRILLSELPDNDFSLSTTAAASTTRTTTTTTTTTNMNLQDFKEKSTLVKDSQSTLDERRFSTTFGKHPGIIILVGALLGVIVLALSVTFSKRRVSSIDERLDRYDQRRPILTELW